MIDGAVEGGLKLILISRESGVSTNCCLLSTRLLAREVDIWVLVSINYNLQLQTHIKM